MRADAKEFSLRVQEAFLSGNDDLLVELHEEANQDYEFYLMAWSYLPSHVRARIKEILDHQP